MRFHWPVLILMLLLVGCKPSKPSGVLSESRMVKILVDYHLAQGMAEGNDNEIESRYLYVQAVFRKTELQRNSLTNPWCIIVNMRKT